MQVGYSVIILLILFLDQKFYGIYCASNKIFFSWYFLIVQKDRICFSINNFFFLSISEKQNNLRKRTYLILVLHPTFYLYCGISYKFFSHIVSLTGKSLLRVWTCYKSIKLLCLFFLYCYKYHACNSLFRDFH